MIEHNTDRSNIEVTLDDLWPASKYTFIIKLKPKQEGYWSRAIKESFTTKAEGITICSCSQPNTYYFGILCASVTSSILLQHGPPKWSA